ncbi:MAG: ABC transporter ATP-binding protein/permease, partial [Deltaproteobacteria bacterium]|nr:ABC transporter ATP-binding protein/permease [Deltaproteobacteria bacterium]
MSSDTDSDRSARPSWRLMLRVVRYFLPYRWHIVIGVLSSGVVSLTTAGSAWLIKPAMDKIFLEKDGQALLYIPLAFIVLTLFKGVGRYVQNWCMNASALRVLETLRQELFYKIIGLPLRFFEGSQVGVLMARILNDVMMIRQSLPAFVQIVRQSLTMLGLIAVVFHQNWRLACWALFVLPLAGAPFVWFSRKLRRYGRRNAEVNADVSGMLQELLSGIRVIKAFATERQETRRFDVENARIVDISLRQISVTELSSPVMELIGALGIGLVIWVGGMEVINGSMTPGTFFSFVGALIMLYDPVKSLSSANMAVQNALAGAERVFAILDAPDMVQESGGDTAFDEPFRELVFDRVSLSYSDEPGAPKALDDISFSLGQGERVALVGPSGAGKTSLVNLIPRFYVPGAGRIVLNGRPIEAYTLSSLRRAVAVVSQDTFLFDTSIRDNIAYGTDAAADDDITAAAAAAYANGFVCDLPEGYATRIGERGVKLSGGQKQRLTIARALLKDAPLLILDEATSALDSESER